MKEYHEILIDEQSDKMIEIITDDKFMQSNRTDWEAMRETLLNELSTKLFFSADTPSGDMMGRPGHFLIEDYENIISMDSKWIDIGIHEQGIEKHHAQHNIYINGTSYILISSIALHIKTTGFLKTNNGEEYVAARFYQHMITFNTFRHCEWC